MSKILPLEELTLHEKLAAMEALWEDLARSPEFVEITCLARGGPRWTPSANFRWEGSIRGLGNGQSRDRTKVSWRL